MASLFPRHLWKLLFGDLHDFSLHSWIAQGILAERFVCFWRAWGVWICWICVPKPWGKTRKKTCKTTWTPWKKSGLQPTINPVQFFMFCIAQAGKPSLMSFPTQPKPSGSSWPAFFTASCTFQITSWSEIHDSRFFGSKCLFQNGEPDRGAIWRPPTLSRSIVPKHFVLSLIISIKRKIVLNVLDMCVCLNCGLQNVGSLLNEALFDVSQIRFLVYPALNYSNIICYPFIWIMWWMTWLHLDKRNLTNKWHEME